MAAGIIRTIHPKGFAVEIIETPDGWRAEVLYAPPDCRWDAWENSLQAALAAVDTIIIEQSVVMALDEEMRATPKSQLD